MNLYPTFSFETFSWAEAFTVFIFMLVTDVIWVFYIRRTAQGKSFQAASMSALMSLTSALVVVSYIENSIYLIPTAIGAFVGTILSIRFDKPRGL